MISKPRSGTVAFARTPITASTCFRSGSPLRERSEDIPALADGGRPIGAEHLSDRIRQTGEAPGSSPTLNEAIEQLKCRMIDDALRECSSKTRAAERLGLSRQSLQQMLRRRQA